MSTMGSPPITSARRSTELVGLVHKKQTSPAHPIGGPVAPTRCLQQYGRL